MLSNSVPNPLKQRTLQTTGLFMELGKLYKTQTKQHMNGLEVSMGQPMVLLTLLNCGECSQTEIADHLRVSPPTIAVTIKRMEKVGLLKKVVDKNDLRINRIALTPQGETLAQTCLDAFVQVSTLFFTGFNDSEIVQFRSYLDRIRENLLQGQPPNESVDGTSPF